MAAEKKTERNFIIGFNKVISLVPTTKRAPKAVKYIKAFMKKHFKVAVKEVVVSSKLNNLIWADGIGHIPRKVEVKAVKHDNKVHVLLLNEEFKIAVPKKVVVPKVSKAELKEETEKKAEQEKKLEEKRIKEKTAEGLSFKKK